MRYHDPTVKPNVACGVQYYDVWQAAKMFGVGETTVWRWSKKPKHPLKLRSIGNTIIVFAEDLQDWIKSSPVRPYIPSQSEEVKPEEKK